MKTVEYDIAQDQRLADIQAALQAHVPLNAKPPKTLVKYFLDSDDWRLYQQDLTLTAVRDNQHTHLELRRLYKHKTQCNLDIEALPRVVSDIPSRDWQQKLRPVLEARALIPQAELHVKQHPLYMEEAGRTVLRAYIEDARVRMPDGRLRPLGHRLKLLRRNRKDRCFKKARKAVENACQLSRVKHDEPLLAALGQLSVIPAGYTGKPRYVENAAQRSDEATRHILLELLDIMEHNEAGIINDIDTEFLHDFRVAVRRTRSALGQIKDVLPQSAVDDFRHHFAWLNAMTGDARDLDVYLLHFDQFTQRLPPPLRPHLEPLREFLKAQRAAALHNVVNTLQSQHCQQLKTDWRSFLTATPSPDTLPAHATEPIKTTADRCIRKAYRRVARQGGAITPASPAEEVHELRKSCKKLRYLLEFFHACYAAEKIDKLIKSLKKLQDYLGRFQDLHVQSLHLKSFERQMAQTQQLQPQTHEAMETLRQILDDTQSTLRQQFDDYFAIFARPPNHRRYRQLFKTH